MSVNWYRTNYKGWFQETCAQNGSMAYSVYIPPSGVNANTKIHVFSCNPHDYGTTWFEYVRKHQDPNCVYMVIPSIQDGGSSQAAANFFAKRLLSITNEYHIPTENINMYSWSNGNKGISAIASSLNGKGYTIGKFINVFGNFDGSNSGNFFSNFKTGKSAAFPYIYINDGSNHTN